MAVSAGMPLLSTAAGVAVGTIAIGSAMTYFLVTTAMGAALNALTPKPSISKSGRQGYNVTQTSSIADHQIIYGRTKVFGVRVFDQTTGTENRYLHRVVAFTGHEIESFDEIYINDELVTIDGSGNVTNPSRYNGYLRIKEHLGSTDQVADNDLVAEVGNWTNSHRLQGISYLYLRFDVNEDAFPNGVPEVSAVIKGKKVYDPRTETTVWSDNPALCILDYLTNQQYGLKEELSSIDTDLFSTAANVCDYYNYPTLTGVQRYTCNGSFTTATTPYDLLNNILTSMGGMLWYSQGKWRCKPAYWTESQATFDENDLRSSISVSTRHSRRDNFNAVNGTWKGEASNWQITDYPIVKTQAFIDADNGKEKSIDLALPFTSDVDMARRIANIYLERNRQQLTFQASFGLSAFKVQVGDIVTLNNTRFGWVNKDFEVVSWTFGLVDGSDLQVQMTLRETAESVFDDIADGVVYERDNTILPSPFTTTPVGINVVAEAQVSNQKVSNVAVITITATTNVFINYVEVEFRKTGDTDWRLVGTGPVGIFKAGDLETGNYDFRARSVNTFNVRGDWEYALSQTINAFIGDPSDVGGFDVELSGGTLFLSWTPIPDPDLSHYIIKHNSNTTGATWSNSTTVIEKVPRPATNAALPARSGTFLIRAYDKEDNFSENVTTRVVLPSELPQLGTTDTQTEDPTFAGSKTNTAIVSSTLQIDDTSAASPSGEYFFSAYIDTGSSRNCRVTGFRTFTRAFDGGGTLLWDDIPGNWDTWPGEWDTWTDENAEFGDVNVNVFVSATDDDPAGTPTWGDYVLANGNFIIGRAFRFKAILSSTNANYTPAVSALSVDVEY